MDAQREFDAIWAAQQIDQQLYGINPDLSFNDATYLQMQQTLQSNQQLRELGIQGHGLNGAVPGQYAGYTQDFQNNTDNTTNFVGGGVDNGDKALAQFLDDVALTHAPFPEVAQSGTIEQLNQNGNREDPMDSIVAGANESEYTRVFVSGDFSANAGAQGPVILTPNQATSDDVTGDGTGDIVWQSSSGAVAVWSMSGGQIAGLLAYDNPGPSWRLIGSADISGDGRSALLWQNSDGTPMAWIMNDGATAIEAAPQFADPGPNWQLVGAGDLDASGHADLLFQNDQTGAVSAWMTGDGGTAIVATIALGTPGAGWKLVGTGDLNGDGRADLLFQNADGAIMAWYIGGTPGSPAIEATATFIDPGPAWHLVGAADVAGSGRDALLLQSSDGTPAAWIMGQDGMSVQNYATYANPGVSWQLLGGVDANGTGSADLLLQSTSGQVALWTMADGGTEIGGTSIVGMAGAGWSIREAAEDPSSSASVINQGSDALSNSASGVEQLNAGNGNELIASAPAQNTTIQLGSGPDVVESQGTDTILGGTGAATVSATANALLFAQGNLMFANSSGNSTVVGAGAMTVAGGSGSVEMFAGAGAVSASGGAAGNNVLAAGSGNATLVGGGNGDIFLGGSAGSDVMTTAGTSAIFAGAANVTVSGGSGPVTTIGGSGQLVVNQSGSADVVFGGGGPVTVNDSGGIDYVVGGPGSVTVNQGSATDILIPGTGSMALNAGSGPAILALFDGAAGGTITVNHFQLGLDQIDLTGYGAQEAQHALATASSSTAGTTLTFSDGTHVLLAGAAGVTGAIF